MHEYAAHAGLMGNGAEGFHVVDVRVHAAIAQQANEVQGLVVGQGVLQGFGQGGHLRQLALADGLADAHQLLVDHPAGPDVHVAHLGVAHLALGQAHGLARGLQRAVREALQQFMKKRRTSRINGRNRGILGNTPAIENHQQNLLTHPAKIRQARAKG